MEGDRYMHSEPTFLKDVLIRTLDQNSNTGKEIIHVVSDFCYRLKIYFLKSGHSLLICSGL